MVHWMTATLEWSGLTVMRGTVSRVRGFSHVMGGSGMGQPHFVQVGVSLLLFTVGRFQIRAGGGRFACENGTVSRERGFSRVMGGSGMGRPHFVQVGTGYINVLLWLTGLMANGQGC